MPSFRLASVGIVLHVTPESSTDMRKTLKNILFLEYNSVQRYILCFLA